jgi:hypothetical protein
MSDALLDVMRDLIQEDVGNRGLRTDPADNLVTACPDDFRAACRSLAGAANPAVGVVTGFFIPHAQPPCGETDGPLGALFLARALAPLGVPVLLATDAFCVPALAAGLEACGLSGTVRLVTLPAPAESAGLTAQAYWRTFLDRAAPFPQLLTHLVALERVGPSHTPASLRAQAGPAAAEAFEREVPAAHHDRCHTMRGRDITEHMSPAHLLFEAAGRQTPGVRTIGIGDGGNEIGMGRIGWDVIRRNIPGGATVACRVATDQLLVCGVSNWGAYALAAGVRLLRGAAPAPGLFDVERERELLEVMVERGPLVDGVSGRPTVSVDGLAFERYAEVLRRLGEVGV